MKFLAVAEARDLCKAKSPSGIANAFEEGLNYLGALVDSPRGDQSTYGEAYATTSDSELSADKSTKYRRAKRTSRSSRQRSPSRSPSPPPRQRRDRGSSKRRYKKTDTDDQPKDNCRHCKKFGRIKAHPNFRRLLAIGTRKASLGALTGSARKWTSTMSSDLSSLQRMEATPVTATRVMADGVGI